VCYGGDVLKAFFKMETVEHFARVTLVAELLGGPKVLPRHEVGKLFEARGRYGVKSHNRMEPGRPVVAEDEAAENAEGGRDRLNITRDELIAVIEEALRSRGVLT
jgi:L-fuculose-phosphate aldolase